jgi:hypothetical protein
MNLMALDRMLTWTCLSFPGSPKIALEACSHQVGQEARFQKAAIACHCLPEGLLRPLSLCYIDARLPDHGRAIGIGEGKIEDIVVAAVGSGPLPAVELTGF